MTIFDLMTSNELVAYWEVLTQDEAPYPCEELFPDDKKRGLTLQWLKGAKGLPVVLKASAFDAHAVPRGRIGFDKLSADMPYFKESTYVDEELRQELNMVLETGNQSYIDSVMNRIFDDEVTLLRGARATRERMRTMILMTGVVSMTNNGQAFSYDYGIERKRNAVTKWSNTATADPVEDLRVAIDTVLEETGYKITRGICNSKTWRNLRNNEKIKKEIFVLSNGVGALNDNQLKVYLADQLDGFTLYVDDKRYVDESGTTTKFIPDDTVSLFPDGALGKTWFGTTPAESDLMSSNVANVTITDTGVAVTTVSKADPVNVETIVSMICLPSCEMADGICILDTEPS